MIKSSTKKDERRIASKRKFFSYRIAAEGFQRLNYDRRYATACYYIGDALFLLGECKKANSYLLKSLQVGQEFDDCRLMYLTYSKLSSTCALLSEYSLGNTYSKEMMSMRNRIVEKKKAGCPCRQLDTADTTSERHWAVSSEFSPPLIYAQYHCPLISKTSSSCQQNSSSTRGSNSPPDWMTVGGD
ncbi:unnamed protein product [Nippostrongylus brasiliensis]|uniref:TPR_REGION domain-containing protein n=1 Tax=Nippostrongylus brasiliensis TaxID=27835 RepID=A0A0N4XIH2_NIPBR|nr:unnamed protein product [Nippostrongylus brasiliensis]